MVEFILNNLDSPRGEYVAIALLKPLSTAWPELAEKIRKRLSERVLEILETLSR